MSALPPLPPLHRLPSPVGVLGAAFNGQGKLTQLWRLREGRGEWPPEPEGPEPKALGFLNRQLASYFAGTLRDFNIPMEPSGTDFQVKVWKELQRIPYGQAISYLELAKRLGDEKCIRAAARANGANPISILIPCHRVIGSDGGLTGYGGGLDMKEHLLKLEGVLKRQDGAQPGLFD
ncbi:MAG: methylated-DNA--[protein]-cysteine S-methyltransferase [Acidobacteria bacterium]|nr:methylated-DNA--[protein]-cysteine S-methyltransferase [Acidobacteriota bacterium]